MGEYRPLLSSIETHAFLLENGGPPIDLNSALAPGSGWRLLKATGIDDAGQIAAFGSDAQGRPHALWLDPVGSLDSPTPIPMPIPEPTTLALVGLVSAGLVLRRSFGGLRGRRPHGEPGPAGR